MSLCRLHRLLSYTAPPPPVLRTLSLHDALPIFELSPEEWGVDYAYSCSQKCLGAPQGMSPIAISERALEHARTKRVRPRSEEHTSELQSRGHLVCRLLLEKKNPQ